MSPIRLERVTGIEPVTRAWKARMLPLHHTRINDNYKVYLIDCQVSLRGLEPPRINSLEPKPSASTNSATSTNDSGRTRTYDRLLRRQLLYPTELASHVVVPIAATPEPPRGMPQLITVSCDQQSHHTGLC